MRAYAFEATTVLAFALFFLLIVLMAPTAPRASGNCYGRSCRSHRSAGRVGSRPRKSRGSSGARRTGFSNATLQEPTQQRRTE
jgi:hypothetical protein